MTWSGLPEKVELRIIPEPMSGCWIWLGPYRDNKDRYGGMSWKGKHYRTHKFVYEFLKGVVPAGLTLDHICRNRICCNPDHLEPVTWQVNILRGEGIAAKNAVKTHCKHGHSLADAYVYQGRMRQCRTCGTGHKRAYEKRMAREGKQ